MIGGLYNGVDKPATGDVPLIDANSGAVNRRSVVSRDRAPHRGRRAGGGPTGVRLRTGDGTLRVELDQQKTEIVVKSDGTGHRDSKQGVTVDAGTGTLTLKGKDVAITAQSGVKVDGGAGAVAMSTNAGVNITGLSVSVNGSTSTEVKSGGICSVTGSLVKIN